MFQGNRLARLCLPGRGFTLVELLIALSVSGLVLSAAGAVIVQHMRFVRSLELAQRQRDNAARLDYLIQVEASEAAEVSRSETLSGCARAGNSEFTLSVPDLEGTYDTDRSTIHYYNSDGNIRRCGPPSNQNGTLKFSSSARQDGIAIREASLSADPAQVTCDGEVTTSTQVVYQITYQNGYEPGCSKAQAKTIRIQ